jgi:hypothetical protein
MKVATLEDEQKYLNICTSLKKMADIKAASTIAKWERAASAIKTVANLLTASNKDMIEQFDHLSGTIIENMPYVPAALFSDFRSACSRLKDCQNIPATALMKVEKWNQLLTETKDEKTDDGVKALLKKCPKLQEFAIFGRAENAVSGAIFFEEVRLPKLRHLVFGN